MILDNIDMDLDRYLIVVLLYAICTSRHVFLLF